MPSPKDAAPPSDEPSPEQLAQEQTLLDEGLQAQRDAQRKRPAAGKDILATYMEHLSQIPLFTPEQELENAKHLETLELMVWRLILQNPRGAEHVAVEMANAESAVRTQAAHLLQSYQRATSRSRKKHLEPTPLRKKAIDNLARAMRDADADKEHLEGVLRRLRRDVWCRRVIGSNPAFRVTHADLTEIERAQGTLLRARNNFVRANLRLVVSVARGFHHYRMPFIDLIQEGNVGLMKAVHRFDHRRGFRFSTYAHWWIRQSIERALINKGSQVRLPVHIIDARRQLARAKAQLHQELGRAPTMDELSRYTNLSKKKIHEITAGVQQDPVSLDESVSKDDPRRFMDMLRDEAMPEIDEEIIRENTYDRIKELMHLLNPIEKDIIRRRFGLGDDSDQTLDEIGKLYNLSRERVRQIQAQGIMKMRRMCERRHITSV